MNLVTLNQSKKIVYKNLMVVGFTQLLFYAAINPTNQLNSAQGSKRTIEKREIENAVIQYIIDGSNADDCKTMHYSENR